jgi:hypothetical protein
MSRESRSDDPRAAQNDRSPGTRVGAEERDVGGDKRRNARQFVAAARFASLSEVPRELSPARA